MTGTDSIYQAITDRIIKRIEAGAIPWQKPWTAAAGVPKNIVSRKPYRGVNVLILSTSEFSSPWWMTFKQAKELGGNVSKGSKSEIIVFFKRYEKTDANGEAVYDENGRQRTTFVLRYSRVFNLEQTEGIKTPEGAPSVIEAVIVHDVHDDAIAKAKAIVENGQLCPITNRRFLPFYNLSRDRIQIPRLSVFKTPGPQSLYHTLFHEMTHATGHPDQVGPQIRQPRRVIRSGGAGCGDWGVVSLEHGRDPLRSGIRELRGLHRRLAQGFERRSQTHCSCRERSTEGGGFHPRARSDSDSVRGRWPGPDSQATVLPCK